MPQTLVLLIDIDLRKISIVPVKKDKHGYPPVDRDVVYKDIFEQAENFKKYKDMKKG